MFCRCRWSRLRRRRHRARHRVAVGTKAEPAGLVIEVEARRLVDGDDQGGASGVGLVGIAGDMVAANFGVAAQVDLY